MNKQLEERRGIHALQDIMLDMPEEEKFDIESMTSHHFAPGVYAREYFIPKGSVVIGKIHKTEHFNIVCKGKCSVSTEDGPLVFEGPCVFVSRPGVKKAVYAFEDTTWITIHVTEETDLERIEEEVIAKDYDEIETLRIEGA
jgi:quercetin dioxygenase-like cupin family protein